MVYLKINTFIVGFVVENSSNWKKSTERVEEPMTNDFLPWFLRA